MIERQKMPAVAVLLLLGASLLFSWLWVRQASVEPLSYVSQVEYRDGILYGLELQEQDYLIFRLDLESRTGRTVKVPMSAGGAGRAISDLTAARSGKLYLRFSYSEGEEVHQDIAVCNFETGQLEPVIHLEDYPDKRISSILPYEEEIQILCWDGSGALEFLIPEEGGLRPWKRYCGFSDQEVLLSFLESGQTFAILDDGWIGLKRENGELERIFKNQGNQEEGWNQNIQFYPEEIDYENSLSGQRYRIDLREKPYQPVPCENPYQQVKSFNLDQFQAREEDRDGIRFGILSLEDGRSVAAVCGAVEYVADQISWPKERSLGAWLLLSAVLAAVFLMGYGFWFYLKRRDAVIPLVVETAVLAAGMLAAGTNLIEKQVLLAVRKNIEESSVESCIQVGREYVDTFLPENIERMSGYPEITTENRLPIHGEYSLYDPPGASVFSNLRFELFVKKEEEVYALDSYQYLPNLPLQYNYGICSNETFRSIKKALQERKVVSQQTEMLDGQMYSVFIPFSYQEGEYAYLLEVELSLSRANQMIAEQSLEIQRILYGVSGILMVSILFLIWFGMKPLGSLKQAALQVAEGKPGVQARVKGRSEAAATARYFNHMSEQIGKQISGIREYQKKYAAFVPFWFLQSKSEPWQAKDQQKAMESETLYPVMAIGFLSETISEHPRQNQDMEEMIQQIHHWGGDVLEFEEYGLRCMFLEAPESALTAAVNILRMEKQQKKVSGIGIGMEKLRLGITGNHLRSRITACYMDGDISWFLKQWGEARKMPLLMTETAAGEIPGFFSKYHYRLLGELLMNHGKRRESIYEVLDGESEHQQRKKMLTEHTFAKGRKAFSRGDFLSARMAFIQVFSENPEDGAALHYIRVCEKNQSLPEQEKQFCMEVWNP